jgi:hypothetical protein
MARVHRRLAERFLYSTVFSCPHCKRRVHRLRDSLLSTYSTLRFVLATHSRCPRCGRRNVNRLRRSDTIELLTRNPFALIQAVLGAPVKHCHYCRIRYFDWRGIREESAVSASNGA